MPLRLGSSAPRVTSDAAHSPVSDSRRLASPCLFFLPQFVPSLAHICLVQNYATPGRSGGRAAREPSPEVPGTCPGCAQRSQRGQQPCERGSIAFARRPAGTGLSGGRRGRVPGSGRPSRGGVAPAGVAGRLDRRGFPGNQPASSQSPLIHPPGFHCILTLNIFNKKPERGLESYKRISVSSLYLSGWVTLIGLAVCLETIDQFCTVIENECYFKRRCSV